MKLAKRILILGSTGSIGENALEVIGNYPQYFLVSGLSANRKMKRLAEQAELHSARFVIVPNFETKKEFTNHWKEFFKFKKPLPEIYVGEKSLIESASDSSSDTVINAIVGIAGLPASIAAAQSSKRILLANKETLVSAGKIFIQTMKNSGAELLPIDSEHNAIFQCLKRNKGFSSKEDESCQDVRKLILTASGGPFLRFKSNQLRSVCSREACMHPNWTMGEKISVDSSTMMNKGFEVIEAYWLFSVPMDRIDVVIHPQSIVHSMVEYIDGSVLAQLGYPDMRIPISYALGFPDQRLKNGAEFLDLIKLSHLDFEKVNYNQFPCFSLAIQALHSGEAACTVLCAANEIAVENFLSGNLQYTSIPHIISSCLEWYSCQSDGKISSLDDILSLNACIRDFAKSLCCR